MSNFKFEVKIRQHTPILHFQHDQSGATLRATELKPKLDKFLKFNDDSLPFKEHGNLDFKVKISSPPDIQIIDITPEKRDRNGNIIRNRDGSIRRHTFPNFFANMGDDTENYKKALITNQIIKMEFFCYDEKIGNAIKKYFSDFMMITNFGTRQSKGFGSFYVDPTDPLFKEPNHKYKFIVNSTDFKNVFEKIELFYKTLRSGINLKNRNGETTFYFKSMMFLYAKSKGIQWDKKTIKEEYFNSDLRKQLKKYNSSDILSYFSNNKKLMKDLLGLSSTESWFSYHDTITKENENIDRFKSPITFKPIKSNGKFIVYFFVHEIEPGFLGKTFNIKTTTQSHLFLDTPTNFDVNDFLEFALNVNLSKHVADSFHNTYEFKTIKEIYENIKENMR